MISNFDTCPDRDRTVKYMAKTSLSRNTILLVIRKSNYYYLFCSVFILHLMFFSNTNLPLLCYKYETYNYIACVKTSIKTENMTFCFHHFSALNYQISN